MADRKSKFWNSDSDSSEESSSEEQVVVQTKTKKQPKKITRIYTDDESDEEKRVVKSAVDKRFDELRDVIKKAKNARKVKDFNISLNTFTDLTRVFDKSTKVVEKEGIPTFYVRELVEIDDYIKKMWEDKDFRKKLKKDQSKALTTLRQRLKKYFNAEENPEVVKKMESYRENPVPSEEEVEQEAAKSDSDDDQDSMGSYSDSDEEEEKQKGKWAAASDSDGSFDYSSSEEDSSSSDEGSVFSVNAEDDDSIFSRYTIAYFLRKPDEGGKPKKEKKDRVKNKKPRDPKNKDQKDEWETTTSRQTGSSNRTMWVDDTGKVHLFAKDEDVTAKTVIKKFTEISTMRPRKEDDRKNKVLFFQELRTQVQNNKLGLGLELKVHLAIISAMYEYNPKHKDYMTNEAMLLVIDETQAFIDVLNANIDSIVMNDEVSDDKESITAEKNADDQKWHVRGSLVNTCTKLDTEFFKLLQNSDQHSEEYRTNLKSNASVIKIFQSAVAWADQQSDDQQRCQMYLLNIKYIYYRHSSQSGGVPNAEQLMDKYCKFIYTKDETQRIRTQAILYNIYHLALHDKWFLARDLMLMSHLQESIHNADIFTQIIYNRTMVQLGLCAFRKGQMEDAHQALMDIQSGNRARELLAQGFSMARERTQEQERTERRRMQPYHTHVNTELLECVYLVSAMFLEIPYMAEKEFDHRRRMISKQFHYQLRNSEKQAFVGPPDNMREHVLAAAKSLKVGDWRKCIDYLINPKMNQKVWNLFAETEKVKDMLRAYAKKESLRVYLFSYSQFYENLSIEWIMHNFDMSSSAVHSEVSKMIINEELKASWDEPTNSLVLHQTEPTRLQNLALQLSQRLNQLTETNERLCESKQGSNFTAYYAGKANNKSSRDFSGNNQRPRTSGFSGYRAGRTNNFQPQGRSDWNRNSGGGRRY